MQISTPSDLARTVKARRQALGLTQQDVAGVAGITRQSLARIERGSGGTSFDTVLRVFEPLGLTLDAATPTQSTETASARVFRSALEGISAINAAARREPAIPDWQKGLSDFLRRAGDTEKNQDDWVTIRRARLAALDATISATDPDLADDGD